MQEAKSRIEQVIDLCTEGKFTGVLRVDSAAAQGEVQFLSGIRDEVRFGISTGAEALARMIQAPNPRCEAIPSLPNPRGGFKKGLAQEGPLSEMNGIGLMHYCETYALTCTLELKALGHQARASYRIGELVSIELLDQVSDSDRVIADLLQANEGTYQFTLPPFELPESFRSASVRPAKAQDWLQNLVSEAAAGSSPSAPPPAVVPRDNGRSLATEQARLAAEAQTRVTAEAELRRKQEEESRRAEEAKRAEAKRRAEAARAAEAARQAEAARAAQAEAARQAEAEAARHAEAEVLRKAEEARLAELEAARQAEADATRAAEAEAKRAAEAETARAAEAEAARLAEADATRKRQADAAKPASKRDADAAKPASRAASIRPKSSAPPPKPAGPSMSTWIVLLVVVVVVLAFFAQRLLK